MASRTNIIQHPQVYFRTGGFQQGRVHNPHQFENTPITYSQSFTKNPIPQFYYSEPRRSFPTVTLASTPERMQQQKGADPGCVQDFRHIPTQPNVGVQVNSDPDRNKQTRAHCINYPENPHAQSVQITYGQRPPKPAEDLTSTRVQAQTQQGVLGSTRAHPQAPLPVVFKTISGSVASTPTPKSSNPSYLYDSRTEQIVIRTRNPTQAKDCQTVPASRPASNLSDFKVRFEYQKAAQLSDRTTRQEQGRQVNFSEMIRRENLEGVDRGGAQGKREGAGELMELHARARLKESVYVKTEENQAAEEPNTRVQVKRRIATLEEITSNELTSSIIGSNYEQEQHHTNPFRKDKGFCIEDYHSNPSPISSSAVGSPHSNQLKGVRFIPSLAIQQNCQKTKSINLMQSYVNTTATSSLVIGQSFLQSPQSYEPVKLSESPTKLTISPRKSMRKGPKLEDFEVGRKLGKGKYGDVYMVEHKLTGFVCAMKTIEKRLIQQERVEHQFIRQIKLQSFLKHQNIAQLYGYFDDLNNVYLLLELCSDGFLTGLLRERKRLSQTQTASIVNQICNGVDYMHRHRIIHRDLKPQNILVSNESVKICDFGWAVDISDGLRNTFCGTPLYVSPDVLRGDMYDEKIDLWGIGILTYELLVGKVPFKIVTQNDLKKILEDDISFPEYLKISDSAKDFIRKLMKKDPKERMEMDEVKDHPFLRENQRNAEAARKMFASLNNFL